MAVPSFQQITLPLLQLAADGTVHQLADARQHLAERFRLTDAELAEQLPSGRQGRFANRVAWAKVYLQQAGILESPARGQCRITQRGRDILRNPPSTLDIRFMEQFSEFQEFRSRNRPRAGVVDAIPDPDSTPEEDLRGAYERLQRNLAGELLQNVRRLSAVGFERLVVDVMLAMGYGGGRAEAGSMTPTSGDGGIDGVINEDRLGLDVIYIQAKPWENPVGQPEIQKFVGALTGQRARKRVFITTSRFTPDAREYADNIDPRVILIDGESLARLMLDHEVGVTTKDTLRLQKIDSDYFVEE
jgi:restriction system protein